MKLNWTSKFVIFGLIIMAIFLGQQKFRQYRVQKAIELEKQKLQKQSDEIQGKNLELEQTLSFLDSKTYKELIARQQLNMQKEGEVAYGFSDASPTVPTVNPESDNGNNFQKWVNFFLNKPPQK